MSKKKKALLHKGATIAGFVLMLVLIIVTFVKCRKDNEEEEQQISYDIERSYLESELTPNPTVEEPTPVSLSDDEYFINAARGYKFKLPEGFSASESGGIIYIRDTKKQTQIAMLLIPGNFTDGISVYESSVERLYQLTALLEGSDGKTIERGVKNYGTQAKADKTVGSFAVKTEEAEIWWRNTGELDNIVLPSCDYFTTRANGEGIVLVGLSQTEDTSAVFGYMDHILTTFEDTEIEEQPLDMATYSSMYSDGTSFVYPSEWAVAENEDGMVSISAPNSETSPYAGMVIEAFVDTNNRYVEDYAQFTTLYERQFVAPTFTQKVSSNTFEVTPSVDKMEFDVALGSITNCIYMEVNTKILPKSTAVKNSLGVNGDTVHSYRYAYRVGTNECCINFVIPEDNAAAMELMNKIVDSIKIG